MRRTPLTGTSRGSSVLVRLLRTTTCLSASERRRKASSAPGIATVWEGSGPMSASVPSKSVTSRISRGEMAATVDLRQTSAISSSSARTTPKLDLRLVTAHDPGELCARRQRAERPASIGVETRRAECLGDRGIAVTDQQRCLQGDGHQLHDPSRASLHVGLVRKLSLELVSRVVKPCVRSARLFDLIHECAHLLGL